MKKNNKGFTLAELLVAVALIGILVSVSIVIFTGRIAEAKETVCKNEKATMKHGTVIISMTEQVDWAAQFGTGGVNSPSSESIISYLLTEGYIEKFRCPSGGTIYAAEVKSDMVTFRCTYHDDGMEPGEENASNQAAKDLADAVNKYIVNQKHDTTVRNDTIIRDFLKTDDTKFIITGNTSSILTDTVIDYLTKTMVAEKKITDANAEKFKKALQAYREQELYLVPYVCQYVDSNKKVITYYTSKEQYNDIFGSTKGQHSQTSLICYNGRWYFNTNLNGNKNAPNPSTILTSFTKCTDIQERIEELLTQGTLIAI